MCCFLELIWWTGDLRCSRLSCSQFKGRTPKKASSKNKKIISVSPVLERVEDTITEFYQPADAVCCGRTTGLWVYFPSLESGLFAFCRLVQCMAWTLLSSLRHRYPSPPWVRGKGQENDWHDELRGQAAGEEDLRLQAAHGCEPLRCLSLTFQIFDFLRLIENLEVTHEFQ